MKFAIHSRGVEPSNYEILKNIFNYLRSKNIEFTVQHDFLQTYGPLVGLVETPSFSSREDILAQGVNHLLSFGGDGTLLETLKFVKDTSISVMGINLGRLGFLSNVPRESVFEAIDALNNGHFRLEKRSLLDFRSANNLFGDDHFALNDFTIHKRDTGSMISVETYLNGEYFSTYWADGVIVATPTGSTAYSLSCGGPIIFPDSNTFVITPVAPHNLNIRPIIVSDSTVISFRVRGRGANHLLSLDSRFEIIEYTQEIAVQKANFFFNLVKLNSQNFINTLREKLKWGLDNRNL